MMKKIVVLGNSLTAIKTIEALHKQGEEIEATFISQENTFPYYRHRLFDLPSKTIAANKIFYRPGADYEKNKINFLFDKKVTRVNFKRRRLTLDDKMHLEYDFLILSDFWQQSFFGTKGANKSGLFHLKRLSDWNIFVKALPMLDTLVIQSDCLTGLKTALTLAAFPAQPAKEVILLTSGSQVLSRLLRKEDIAPLETLVSQIKGLRIFPDTQITEILGDNETKAVRLTDGKVYGCQAVMTDADTPDVRLFKETELEFSSDQRILVNEKYQTKFENVFALQEVCANITLSDWDISQNYDLIAEEQARVVAAGILQQECVLKAPAPIWEMACGAEWITFNAESCYAQYLQIQQKKSEEILNS